MRISTCSDSNATRWWRVACQLLNDSLAWTRATCFFQQSQAQQRQQFHQPHQSATTKITTSTPPVRPPTGIGITTSSSTSICTATPSTTITATKSTAGTTPIKLPQPISKETTSKESSKTTIMTTPCKGTECPGGWEKIVLSNLLRKTQDRSHRLFDAVDYWHVGGDHVDLGTDLPWLWTREEKVWYRSTAEDLTQRACSNESGNENGRGTVHKRVDWYSGININLVKAYANTLFIKSNDEFTCCYSGLYGNKGWVWINSRRISFKFSLSLQIRSSTIRFSIHLINKPKNGTELDV